MPNLPDNMYVWPLKISPQAKYIIALTRARNNSGYVMTSDQNTILELIELLSSTEEEFMRERDEFKESPIVIAGINSDALKNFITAVVEDEVAMVQERMYRTISEALNNRNAHKTKARR